jgi:hypothetical protein
MVEFPSTEKCAARPGLPDGFFQTKNPDLGKFLGLRMENDGIFYGHL